MINRSYQYDRNGNVTRIDDQLPDNEDRILSYDRRNRLTTANYGDSVFEYEYDDLDNITWQRTLSGIFPSGMGRNFKYKYDERGRLYEVEDLVYPMGEDRYHRYEYSSALGGDRGNVTRRKLAWLINVDQDYVYNLANQMTNVRAHVGGATLASYEYDGNGRRVRITEGTTRRLQMYSQAGQLVYETTTVPGQPVEATEYYYLGRHLVAQKTNGVTTYIHTDALGSVTRKTNSTGGIVEDRIYEPYGESLEVTTRAPQWPQGMAYTGHVLDNLTRITYAQARYYDQLMGRFMSPDPVAPDAGNFNRYWYANNSPFSNIDPDGRASCPSSGSQTTGTHICYDSPRSETGTDSQEGPSENQVATDKQVAKASRSGKLSDGTVVNLTAGSEEQGFTAGAKGTGKANLTGQRCVKCSDGTTRTQAFYDPSQIGPDQSGGHTHPNDHVPLPGPEDGRMARATGKTAYVIADGRAFAVEKTNVGYRVRLISGRPLSTKEAGAVRNQIDSWNQHKGGSGVTCQAGC
ncbi:RHS repeat-associated core domain-containing protein [Dokdonella koreensis]|uniref:Wall-associated protein n=1 Tax=Dokdonella koreensis DS-123 TaxID=1300342 RepID=A0A167GPX2_9GAMM|nr:RHS repeat-associated core domain-containing protein [Dokdonella koreensis]ANB17026.1 Wall-associated protein [Dokdonella koreensis DS-123]